MIPSFAKPQTGAVKAPIVMVLFAIGLPPAAAAQHVEQAEQSAGSIIIVTGSRTNTDSVAPDRIIHRDDIEREQPGTLLETLNGLAGVRAYSTGGAAGGSMLSVRGGETNFTLVQLEGIKLNDPTNSRGGAFDFSLIDPMLIEKVAVTRGAVAAIHGPDALSGLISLYFPEPNVAPAATLAARVGTRGDLLTNGTVTRGWDGGGVVVAASRYRTGDLHKGSDLSRTQIAAKAKHDSGSFQATLFAVHASADSTGFPEDSGGYLLAANRTRERLGRKLDGVSLAVRAAGPSAFKPRLSASWSRQRNEQHTPAIFPGALDGVPGFVGTTEFDRSEVTAGFDYGFGAFSSSFGVGRVHERGISEGTLDLGFPLPTSFDQSRDTGSAYAELTYDHQSVALLNGAVRFDDPTGVEPRVLWRLGISYSPVEQLTLHGSWSNGMHLPSLYALGHPLIGNPDLKAEQGTNREVGVRWRPSGDVDLQATAFFNRFEDLIDFDPATFQLLNRDRVSTRGLELIATLRFSPTFTLSGDVTYVHVESDSPLRGRPKWAGRVQAVWVPFRKTEVSATVRANGDFLDSSIPTGLVEADGHVEADIVGTIALRDGLDLSLNLQNLTNAHYEDAVGVPAPGRRLMATVGLAL